MYKMLNNRCRLFLIMLTANLFFSFHPWEDDTPKGYALLVAVPQTDNAALRKKYGMPGTQSYAPLAGASTDTDKMYAILKQEGFTDNNIVRLGKKNTDQVKEKNILDALTDMASKVKKNDLFVFYYSGHGTRVNDAAGGDEPDGKDEALVTYDSYLLDDALNNIYKKHFSNTRNIMIMDACNAGSMFELIKKPLNLWDDKKEKKMLQSATCPINALTNTATGFSMLYYGASRDENYGYDIGTGGFFTLAFSGVYHPLQWKTMTPKEAACKISTQMLAIHDPGKGQLQYTECGVLSKEFKNNHLFKIK